MKAVISTDWHISSDNVELSKNLMAQQISLAKEIGTKWLICLGDVFECKRAQPENVLVCFKEILDMIKENGMTLDCIAGNHDKTNPYSWDSYLLPFSNHPALHLISDQWTTVVDDKQLVFQSYIKETLWVEKMVEFLDSPRCDKKRKKYLFTHQAMNGSRNNDGSKIQSSINGALLSNFDFCFFGHYHDEQQPLINALHLGAWKQKNFGENDKKGFYTIDFSVNNPEETVKFFPSKFTKFVTVEVDAKDLNSKRVEEFIESFKKDSAEAKVRVKIQGTVDELKSVKTSKLVDAGLKVKTVNVSEEESVKSGEQIQDFENTSELIDSFKVFCQEKGYDFEEGVSYLKKVL